MSLHRRRFIQNAGIVLALPMLESLVPSHVYAQSLLRKKFVGVFSPNGALMPNGANGNWTFDGALKPIVTAGHMNNVAVLRGVSGGIISDPHWLNTAGFLSSMLLTLEPSRPTICGKTLDQYVADHYNSETSLHSIQVGWKRMNRDFSGDHPDYSDRYLDTLSWKADDRPVANINSPQALFETVFSSGQAGAQRLKFTFQRKKSLLDSLLSEISRLKTYIAAEDRSRLESYLDGVRGLEKSLATEVNKKTCNATIVSPGADLPYTSHFMVMHQIIAHALQCDVISSATIMYDDGIGDVYLKHSGTDGHDHHHYAHHSSDPTLMSALNNINTAHATLFAHFLSELKTRGQLERSMVLWGSNMSDGNLHNTSNLPMVIAGSGSDLNTGKELGSISNPILKSDILLEVAHGLGLRSLSSFGAGVYKSTGKRIGIFK